MNGIKECSECGMIINNDIEHNYFFVCRTESDYCFCEDCGCKKLIHSDDVDGYVLREDYKEYYLDDELSDLCVFDRVDRYHLSRVEIEPDWDAIADDIKLGLL